MAHPECTHVQGMLGGSNAYASHASCVAATQGEHLSRVWSAPLLWPDCFARLSAGGVHGQDLCAEGLRRKAQVEDISHSRLQPASSRPRAWMIMDGCDVIDSSAVGSSGVTVCRQMPSTCSGVGRARALQTCANHVNPTTLHQKRRCSRVVRSGMNGLCRHGVSGCA